MPLFRTLSRGGDFRERLDQSRRRLFRVAYSWCHDPALADDLTQEALTKAFASNSKLRDPKALDTWLFSILTNCWRDHFRRSRDLVDIDDITLSDEISTEQVHGQREVIGRVRSAIAELPIGQRQVVTLVDLEGFSYIEAAEILEVPIGTVMSRLCRARRALKALLLQADPGLSDGGSHRIRRVK